MSSRHPKSTQPSPGHAYYSTHPGPRYGMMAETQISPSGLHTLPPPSTLASRPYLPPPSHLEPTFVPQSPQVRLQYSDPSTRQYTGFARHSAYENAQYQDFKPTTQPIDRSSYASGHPHPPLFPSKVSYQSANPGTLYEALSPVDYGSHDSGAGGSLFSEGIYTANPFPTAGQQQPQQSPATSYKSSGTSSSGYGSGPMQFPQAMQGSDAFTIPDSQTMLDRYVLGIRQQPVAARACGFGERDRRVIDPPPIVQLRLRDFDPKSIDDVQELRWPFNIVHCALLSVSPQSSTPDIASDVTMVQDPNQSNRQSRRLMGTLVSSPFVGTDPEAPESSNGNARLGCFFVFPDLSCRQNGIYRLRFTLMKVSMPNMTTPSQGGQGSIAGSVDSETFEVFSAKDFPGMRASTALTKELKRQGATVSVKKGKGQRKRGGSVDERSGSDESDAGEEAPKTKSRKKRG